MLANNLISQTAKELDINEEWVDTIIMWSYKKAKEATQLHKQVEFSGWGKLLISPTKVAKRIKKMDDILVAYEKKPPAELKKIEYVKEIKEYLNERI